MTPDPIAEWEEAKAVDNYDEIRIEGIIEAGDALLERCRQLEAENRELREVAAENLAFGLESVIERDAARAALRGEQPSPRATTPIDRLHRPPEVEQVFNGEPIDAWGEQTE